MAALYITVTVAHKDEIVEDHTYKFDKKRTISVGYATGNDLVIEQDSVSRNQCRISVEGARVFVSDLRTLNPTLVNGKRISTPTPLRPYDTISFFKSHLDSYVSLQAYLDEAHNETEPSQEEVDDIQLNHKWELRKKSAHLQRITASCPDAPAEIIEELSHSYDLETLRCIAKNPNTPPALLSKFAACCTKEILQNPSFLLWLLEDLHLRQFSTDALLYLLSDEEVPVELLSHLAEHSEDKIRCAIAKHPKSTPEILIKIPIEEGSLVLKNLVANPKMPEERLIQLAKHGNERQREMLARQSLSSSLFDILIQDESEEVRWWLAKNKNLSAAQFSTLVKDASLRVRELALLGLSMHTKPLG